MGVLIVLAAGLAVPATANASFPGANGKIAFASAKDAPAGCANCRDIYTINADGSGQTRLTTSPADEEEPQWSPDGNRILFLREFDRPLARRDIWVMDADGSNQTNITNGAYSSTRSMSWSPDGTKIAFGYFPPGGQWPGEIWTMNADGTGAAPIPNSPYTAPPILMEWSPAGDEIIYSSDEAGLGAVYKTQVDGSGSEAIFQGPVGVPQPDWSPDATKIAAETYGSEDFNVHIYLFNPDGTGVQQLPGNGMASPVWAPNASKILFQGNPGLWLMNPDGSNQTQLTNPQTGAEFEQQPDWQPLPGPGPNADVLASITDSPDPVKGGGNLTYTATIKNQVGPSAATGATLTVNLPSQAFYVSATPTQGSCSHAAAVVTCTVGTVPVGGEASVTIQVEPPNVIAPVNLSATGTATASQPDPVTGNNSATAQTQVTFGGYARPRSGTSMFVSLVPAYKTCNPRKRHFSTRRRSITPRAEPGPDVDLPDGRHTRRNPCRPTSWARSSTRRSTSRCPSTRTTATSPTSVSRCRSWACARRAT